MYLRTTARRRKDGSEVRYLQLAHNEWDPGRGRSQARVLYSFGREDQLDRGAIERLVGSLSRVLDGSGSGGEREFVDSRRLGGAWALDGIWRQLQLDEVCEGLLAGRRLDADTERVVFALVANRALDPSSKLAACRWVDERVAIPGLTTMDAQSCYRAMDWLLSVEGELAERVYWQTADLLDLEVDLLFFDTTSTYFEIAEADADTEATQDTPASEGLRRYGKSKDSRPDLPQVVVAMAVTRQGIPIRVWVWPGNTGDQELIRRAKDDLKAWKLSRVVWVGDRGFSSAENRRHLQRCGGHYILGEKLRGNNEATEALARQGRYRQVRDNLQVKEVTLDDGAMRDRFIICFNPSEAERDLAVREVILTRLVVHLTGSDLLTPAGREQLLTKLPASERRFVRATKRGLLRIDHAAVERERHLDGKYLLRTSDPTLSAEDVALGYKQLLEVERGWRDMKSNLMLRPVHHRLEDRIRAHVLLCWLALLLVRIAETRTGDTWRNLRDELDRCHLGTFTNANGTIQQRTKLTTTQKKILADLAVPEPPHITDAQIPATA